MATITLPTLDKAGFDETVDRVRTQAEQLIAKAKEIGTAAVDAYEKALTSALEAATKAAARTEQEQVVTAADKGVKAVQSASDSAVKAVREVLK